jgi:hypothetical protein
MASLKKKLTVYDLLTIAKSVEMIPQSSPNQKNGA